MSKTHIFVLAFCLLSSLAKAQMFFGEQKSKQDSAFLSLAATPPMGWNSWNKFGCNVNEALLKETADAMISSGMKEAGYQYIVIDDCWQVGRDKDGTIIGWTRFQIAPQTFLNLDGVHGASCPVKFFYHHPALAPDSGVEFLQAPDGKVYCRVGQDGKYRSLGAVTKDQPIEVAAQFKVSIAEPLVNARREVNFFQLPRMSSSA